VEDRTETEIGFKTTAEGLKSAAVKRSSSSTRVSGARSRANSRTEGGGSAAIRRKSGSMSGSLHRGWLDIKSAVTGRDDHAIVVWRKPSAAKTSPRPRTRMH